jgi:predicted ArsR family transcriptional regulator
MAKSAPSIRKRVLAVIVEAGLTGRSGDTVADKLDMTVFQVRARIAELHAAGLVADSGRREVLGSGRRGVIWIGAEYAPKPDDPQGDLLAAA